jgi:hypothetical protein
MILSKKMECMNYLKYICKNGIQDIEELPPTEFDSGLKIELNDQIYYPGGWAEKNVPIERLCNNVCWRFITSLFIGNKQSIERLYNLYLEHFEIFIKENNKIVWDMNFLKYLEQEKSWSPVVYNGNHDDSIINVPFYCLSNRLLNICTNKITYTFPIVFDYEPSSCSYLEYKDENNKITRHLNVRMVNYKYLESGHCTVNDKDRITKTKNLYVTLHSNFKNNDLFLEVIENNKEMKLPPCDPKEMFQGIEDIRLYEFKNRIKFLATTVNYSGCARGRVVCGYYMIEKNETYLKDVSVIIPPTNTFKEKNWIPFIPEGSDKEMFIYKWSPFLIGNVNKDKKLDIIKRHEIKFPFTHEVRGSSNILFDGEKYISVVHVSIENTLPKQYYHMFVYLNKTTYRPYKLSRIYHFDKIGVEFCLSLKVHTNNYVLWISRKDRDPLCVQVPIKKIEMIWDL